jgi:hypothetical protein
LLSGDERRTEWVAGALGLASRLLGVSLAGTPLASHAHPGWLVRTVLDEWGREYCYREPMATRLSEPLAFARALCRRWPNGVEATVGSNGRFNAWPRWPYQVAECVRRGARFVRGLVRTSA